MGAESELSALSGMGDVSRPQRFVLTYRFCSFYKTKRCGVFAGNNAFSLLSMMMSYSVVYSLFL